MCTMHCHVLRGMTRQQFDAVFDHLTTRRKEVLLKFLANETDEAIAQSLHIAKSTVRKHLEEICKVFRLINDFSDERRSKRQDLVALFVKYKPELLGGCASVVENERAIANPNAPASQGDEWDLDALVEKVRSQTDASIAEILRINQGMQQNQQVPISSANLISLPLTLDNWQGRTAEIQQLQAWLADTKVKTIGIQGLSGVGKSWLAAYLYESIGFEPKFWADVRHGTDFTVFAQNALMQLAGKSPEELAALREPEQLIFTLLENLRQRPCLLVIDNLETLLDQERHFIGIYRDFFNRWIEHGATSTLLLTTQTQPEVMEGHGCWLPLQGLEAHEGARLLQELGIVGSDEELQDFSRYLNGHPKMLRLVASKLKSGNHVREAEKLNFRQLDLLLNKVPMPYRDRERVLFVSILEQHFQDLTPTLQSFFLNLSLYRRSFERDAAAVFTEGEEPASAWETQQALDELVSRSLLDEIRGNQRRYEFHPFVLQYSKQKAGKKPEILRERVVAYYQSIATTESTWTTLEDVTPYLEIFYHRCEQKQYNHAFKALYTCNDFLNLRGYYALLAEQYEQLVQAWERSEAEKKKRAAALVCLGQADFNLGHYLKTIEHCKEASKIAIAVSDRQIEADAKGWIGVAYNAIGQYRKALKFNRQSLKVARAINYCQQKAAALINIGNNYRILERYQRAIKFYQLGLSVSQEIGLYQQKAAALNGLGIVYAALEQHTQAFDLYQQTLEVARAINHRRREAAALRYMCYYLDFLGQYQAVIWYCQQALKIEQEIGNCIGEANALARLTVTKGSTSRRLIAISRV